MTIDPLVGSALIKTGGALFKGLLGGLGREAEDRRRWELFMKRMNLIKPKGKYSRGIDPVTAKAIENMFRQRGMQVPQYAETEERY